MRFNLLLSIHRIKQIQKGIKKKKFIKLQLKILRLEYINENNKTTYFYPLY